MSCEYLSVESLNQSRIGCVSLRPRPHALFTFVNAYFLFRPHESDYRFRIVFTRPHVNAKTIRKHYKTCNEHASKYSGEPGMTIRKLSHQALVLSMFEPKLPLPHPSRFKRVLADESDSNLARLRLFSWNRPVTAPDNILKVCNQAWNQAKRKGSPRGSTTIRHVSCTSALCLSRQRLRKKYVYGSVHT